MTPSRAAFAVALMATTSAGFHAGFAAAGPSDSLTWISGCWERQTRSMRTTEFWLEPSGGTLLGLSRTTRGDTLVEYEFVRIYERGDTLVYAASPSGQAGAEFRDAPPHGPELVFENLAHDFPQRIRYRRAGPDSLIASIEGPRGGQTRTIVFAYRRVACKSDSTP